MNTPLAFDILVWVLGTLLGVFLILSIIALILVLRLIASLRQIVAKGEQFVDNAEAIGETLKKNASAVSIVRTVWQLINAANKYKKRG